MANNITLPDELIKKLEIKIKETDFNSIQDYITYVLNQLISSEKAEEVSKEEEVAYTPEEEEELKKRLDEMGYI